MSQFKNIKVPAKLTLTQTARMPWKMVFLMKRRNTSRKKKINLQAGLGSFVLLSLYYTSLRMTGISTDLSS